jgi:diaminohydroxyphosphoribosylaminopyrimidine deaminase/5-amino-6-(5-phosphoribosylamino)uracil reductase
VTRVFSEGGPRVGAALIEAGLADDVILIAGERPLGRAGLPALAPEARRTLADPTRYRRVEEARLGADRLSRYERML